MRTDFYNSLHSDFARDLSRLTVGFEPTFRRLLDLRTDAGTYPPYNIIQLDENNYQIDIALAGFRPEEIRVQVHQQELTVEGQVQSEEVNNSYLFKGIATRNFQRKFSLGDHVEVTSAKLKDGLLTITLYRDIPESAKPREISVEVVGGTTQKKITN